MRIGAKTMTAVTLLAASVATAGLLERFRADYLAQLDAWTGFAIGVFAVLAASAVYHFGRLAWPSEHHLRIEAWESPRIERADPFAHAPRHQPRWWRRTRSALLLTVYLVVFLQVGLVTIDNRGVALMASSSRMFAPLGYEYCLEEPPPPSEDPRLAGCGLLRRAYELGYASDLGPCAPRAVETVDTVCRRRQLDEPYLHYAWRLLNERGPALVPDAVEGMRTALTKLERQWRDLEALARAQHDSIARTPRSSHHLFTNLPPPRAGVVARAVEAVDAGACDARSIRMPPLADVGQAPRASSLVVEHVMGQLLFNPAYPTVVAACREHTIHWNAPPDACERLVNDPTAALGPSGALADIQGVIGRHRRAVLAWRLREERRGGRASARPPPLSRIVSFQCLIVDPSAGDSNPSVEDRTTSVAGHRLAVRELRVTPPGPGVRDQIRLFTSLSRLFAPGFAYGKLQSEQSLADADAGRAAAERFAESGDLLTKLELLRETDIFLGHEWIDDRPDLLAVYPYHVHLTNFVEAFRRRYRLTRSRL